MDIKGRFERREVSVDRRDVLMGIGGLATMAGIASAKSITGNYSTDTVSYEEWIVPENESVKVDLADGDTFENVMVDITAPGANLYVVATGNPSNWTIRNIGWKGTATVDDNLSGWGGAFQMTVSGDGLIENVYIDNRDADLDTEVGGGLVTNYHSGTVTVRNTFIAGCGNNAFYGSNATKKVEGNEGGNGSVEFYNCYHRDNTVSQFRIGGPDSIVKDCLAIVHDPNGLRGNYPDTPSKRARGVWTRNAPDNHTENVVAVVESDDVDPWYTYMVNCIDRSNFTRAAQKACDTRHNSDNPEGTHVTADSGRTAELDGNIETHDITSGVVGDGGVPLGPREAARGDRTLPDPSEAPRSSYSSPGCPYTVVEDHDAGGTLGDYYSGSGFSVVEDEAIEGTHRLEIDSQWATIGYNTTGVCSRGNAYRARLVNDDGTTEVWFLAHVQDPANPMDNCYGAKVDAETDRLHIVKRSGGSTAASKSVSVTTDAGQRVQPEVATDGSGNVVVRLYDQDEDLLAETSTLADTEHSGGTFGFYSGSPDGKVDFVTEW